MKLARPAATLVAALVLAGCSSDPEPRVEPSESPPETSASPTHSTDPRDLERTFLERYVKEISLSLGSGDPSGFVALSNPDCESCQSLAANLTEAYGGGGRISGGNWVVKTATYVRQDSFGSIWNVDIKSSRERWLDGNGETVRIIEAGLQRFGFAIQSNGSSFEMREIRTRG